MAMTQRLAVGLVLAINLVALAEQERMPSKKNLEGAHWELHALGIVNEQMRSQLVTMAVRRPVTVAIVGLGGVSKSLLANYFVDNPLAKPHWLPWFNAFEYRESADDPKAETHDTRQVRVILELTMLLGIRVRLLVYQPPDSYEAIGKAFEKAGREADIIVCFHSFWGEKVSLLAEKTRQTSNSLFIAPYVEYQNLPTGTSWQAHARKHDGSGIAHFITCIPLAKRTPGELLHPSARDANDTEAINFIAPSFSANGPGETSPAAATTTAVAAFVIAASVRKPTPNEVVQILRETVAVDREALTSLAEFDDETVKRIETEISYLTKPTHYGQRKLDAEGILNLRNIYRRLVSESIPPATRPARGMIRPMRPKVCIQKDSIELENAHFIAQISTKPTLMLRRLFNKHTLSECIASGQSSPLFAVSVDENLMTSDKFEVVGARSSSKGSEAVLKLSLRSPMITAELSATLNESCRMQLSLEVMNTDAKPHQLRIFFPLLNHLLIGDVKENYYFYPFKGGWTSNVPFHLGHGYGTPTGSLQVISVFNPILGGGVYVWVKDRSGAMKTLWLRKVEQDGVMPPVYEALRQEMRASKIPFDLASGISIAFSPLPIVLAPNQRLTLPDAVIGVHAGDWREALKSYTSWVRTWWRPPNPKVPVWFRRCFNICALHEHESMKRMRYSGPEKLRPSHHLFQWSVWWEHPEVDRFNRPKPGNWYRLAFGDYQYELRWGGLEALQQEIKRIHNAGLRVVMYVQSYLVWKHSRLGKEHGDDWVARSATLKPLEDWTSEETDMDVWDFCVGTPAYQEYVAKTCKRILTETGADGIYLDSAADAYPCYDKRHGHGNEPARFSLEMLRKVRKAIKEANPQAILHIEDVCSEHHLQFIDGAWLKEFEMYPPMSNYTPHFTAYPIFFLRFYFPEVWFADWGTGDYAPGWRWCLFNGIGTCRWPNDYTARTGRVMKENAEAFATLQPEPLVKTEKEGVLANRFPTRNKIIYTVYNRNADEVSGVLLKVPHRDNWHYVELLSGDEVRFETRGAEDLLSFAVPANEVVVVAQLPKVLDVHQQGNCLRVQLLRKVSQPRLVLLTTQEPDDLGQLVPLRNGKAQIELSQLNLKSHLVVLKLFSGEELVDSAAVKVF